MGAWLRELYLWNFRKPLGLEPKSEGAAARDEGLACHKLSLFWPQGPEYLLDLDQCRVTERGECMWGQRNIYTVLPYTENKIIYICKTVFVVLWLQATKTNLREKGEMYCYKVRRVSYEI